MAEDGDAGVDGVRAREPGAAPATGLTLVAIGQELELKVPLLAGAGAIVAYRGTAGADRRLKDAPDLRMQPAVILRRELARRLGGVDPCRVERLVGVDVPDAGQVLLIHDHLLHRLA